MCVALMAKAARIEASDVGSREMFLAMNRAVEFHALRPVVDRVLAFDQLPEALACLREARHSAKSAFAHSPERSLAFRFAPSGGLDLAQIGVHLSESFFSNCLP